MQISIAAATASPTFSTNHWTPVLLRLSTTPLLGNTESQGRSELYLDNLSLKPTMNQQQG
ncbi:MAG TPA: hypothetical protein V6D10_09525 [Trichocoleus sp.]